MIDFPILSLMTFLPLLGVVFLLLFVRGRDEIAAINARWTAIWTSLFTLALSVLLLARFDPDESGFQFVERSEWLPALNIAYHMGIDGISLFFVVLSAFLTPICIIASWRSIQYRVKEYMIAFLLLETFMIGTFCALDLVLFYIFFEGVLIPMFLIIGIWGGKRRIYAAFKFFLYTFLGSILMLVAVLTIYADQGTSAIPELLESTIPAALQYWLWLAFFASFAVKIPMWPVHTWLPDAHVEAPTAGSVILAGVLLKMGGYGFVRFSLPMFPVASEFYTPFVFTLSLIAIIYTSLVALVQQDMKKLIAYSSIAHMGFVTLGTFTMTVQGLSGAIFQMLSHGIISAALFLVVGVVYDRLHTRQISRYGGLVNNMPVYAVVFMIFTLGSVGLPGTSGFVGEFLSLLGAYQVNTGVALIATLGVVLGAAYMLTLYRSVVFGSPGDENAARMPDLNLRELCLFAPLVLGVIVLGVMPNYVLDRVEPSVQRVIERYETKLARSPAMPIDLLDYKQDTTSGTDKQQ